MPFIRFEEVEQRYGAFKALHHIDLDVIEGEFFSLLGPSGSGKTTLLRLLAGFEPPSQGRIFIDSRDVTNLPPEKRSMGMVFQNYALFPHLNVFDNIAYGLKARGAARSEIEPRVREALDVVDLSGFERRDVHSLSGGQQQRVALARAIAPRPRVLLMDEPLSNLDARLRLQTRSQLRDLQKRLGITTVYVTHDHAEAFALSDRLAVLMEGQLLQVGTPSEVYLRPRSRREADFLGEMNWIPARKVDCGGAWTIEFLGFTSPLPDHLRDSQTSAFVAGVRPEGLGPPGLFPLSLTGDLKSQSFEGDRLRLEVECLGVRLVLMWPTGWVDGMVLASSPFEFSMDTNQVAFFPAP